MRRNLDSAVRTGFLTQRAGGALVAAVLIALEDQTSTVTLGHMECRLAVLRVLLGRFVGEEVLEVLLPIPIICYSFPSIASSSITTLSAQGGTGIRCSSSSKKAKITS